MLNAGNTKVGLAPCQYYSYYSYVLLFSITIFVVIVVMVILIIMAEVEYPPKFYSYC